MKKVVEVKFVGNPKIYMFCIRQDIEFKIGEQYYITNESQHTYDTPVTIVATYPVLDVVIEEMAEIIGMKTIVKIQTVKEFKAMTSREKAKKTRKVVYETITPFDIQSVHFNVKKGITTVVWKDGTVTMVKCINEPFDKEKGMAMCFAKKACGNTRKYFESFKKWASDERK